MSRLGKTGLLMPYGEDAMNSLPASVGFLPSASAPASSVPLTTKIYSLQDENGSIRCTYTF